MLSNPPSSGLQARQHLHRRQISTPTAYEATKIASKLPQLDMHNFGAQPVQSQTARSRIAHRRGMSLDTRRQQLRASMSAAAASASSTTPMQDQFPMVSNNTNNTGYNHTQHVLREAQQQRTAGPGHRHQLSTPTSVAVSEQFADLSSDENYLLSPHGTPQRFGGHSFGAFQSSPMQSPLGMYNAAASMAIHQNNNMLNASQDFELFPSSALSSPTFINVHDNASAGPDWFSDSDNTTSRRGSRRVSNGIMDRVTKFETMASEEISRPLTPTQHKSEDYSPLTPLGTPLEGTVRAGQLLQRFAEGYDDTMEETLKPTRRSNQRSRTTFDDMRQAAEAHGMPTIQSHPSNLDMLECFDQSSLMLSGMNNLGPHAQFTIGPDSLDSTPDLSQQTSPSTPHLPEYSHTFDFKPELHHAAFEGGLLDPTSSSAAHSGFTSPHRRTESVASLASAASIASLDIEKTKTTTGITHDEIQQFIEGPDPKDNKWICTFEDCNKKFGRKENIKSHVQTHLNDRQYVCPHCSKCFVRQHDLKRHAKIHTGIKPYPCECGNSFARHDALTRHKQRGMCVGAFDGVVRKVVKRGRPRKNRPEMDERKDKSARTRRKNESTSSVSSQSVYSDSSAANSPEDTTAAFDMLDGLMDVSVGGTTMSPMGLHDVISSTAPMPCLSVDLSAGEHSPSADSVHTYVSQLSHMSIHPHDLLSEHSMSNPASPAKSAASHFNELPELSRSSSPPTSCTQFFDLEPSSSAGDIMISTGIDMSGIPSLASPDDDDILLQFTHSDSVLMLGAESKFDDAFDNSTEMFTTNNDLFFGSN
ncbi:regulatory protein SWI5 [Microdochium nivale]|nr:regulatory protein SWI5 [Microdochium nivale]